MSDNVKDFLTLAAWLCSTFTTIAAATALFVKPVREKLFAHKKREEAEVTGIQCLLRSDMLRTYYTNKDKESIKQFEFENFVCIYRAYKALGGNSFVDHIKEEIDEWEIDS